MYRNGIFTEKYTQTATLNEGEQRRETLISKKKPIQPSIYQNIRTEILIKSELTFLHKTNTERGTRSTYFANTRSTHKTIRHTRQYISTDRNTEIPIHIHPTEVTQSN